MKTPLPAMNAPEVGLETEMAGFWASETEPAVTVSSLERPSASFANHGRTEKSLQVFAGFERFSTKNVTVLHDTDAAQVHETVLSRKQFDTEESLDESKSERLVESGFEKMTASHVPLTKDAEENVGYVIASAVITADEEETAVEYSPFFLYA